MLVKDTVIHWWLFNGTVRVGLKFCPMEYINIMSRELQRKLQGYVVQAQQRRCAVDIARLRNITSADISELDGHGVCADRGDGKEGYYDKS